MKKNRKELFDFLDGEMKEAIAGIELKDYESGTRTFVRRAMELFMRFQNCVITGMENDHEMFFELKTKFKFIVAT